MATLPAPNDTVSRYGPLAALLLVAAFAASAALPVSDIDYWWHVAAGRWIVEHHQLPTTDPFGVFGDANPVRALTVLRGQWLGQVVLWAAHLAAGPAGAVALRVLLLASALAVIILRARRAGASWVATLIVASTVAFGLVRFTGERPQLLGFPLFALLLLVLELRDARRPAWTVLAVGAIGLVWVNAHGSVLLAVLLVAGMAATETVSRLALRRPPGDRTLWLAAGALAVVTAAGPNGLRTFSYALTTQASELAKRTTEYVSSLAIAGPGGSAAQAGVYAALALGAVALPTLVRVSPTRAAALVALGLASVMSYRYHSLYLIGAGPWIAQGLTGLEARLRPPFIRAARLAPIPLAALSAALLFWTQPPLQALRGAVNEGRVPRVATEHLRSVGAQGRALVWFEWSGFALEECAPAVTPFVDPRMLDDALLRPYTHMIWATPEGLAALDRSGVDWVLLPFQNARGESYPLHAVLRQSLVWKTELSWDRGALYRRVR
jgi:hypothetical protein